VSVNSAKRKLAEGKRVLFMGLRQARSADIVLIAAECGFDGIYVDLQHSPLTLETASTLCIAALGAGLTPIVRPPGHAPEMLSRALDAGAQGLLVPDVEDAGQASALVAAAKFPPLGRRSVMGPTPALGYRASGLGKINELLNAETLVIAMLETARGVENAEAIAAVPGIDMLLIGSNDLCTSLGIPGELRHPKLRAAYETAAAACGKHGKHLGVGGIRGDAELQQQLIRLGARFIIAGNDTAYLAAAARKDVETLRALT
jgi:2-keto-3-deoxy-L-rhamnonate aldolase RhmA